MRVFHQVVAFKSLAYMDVFKRKGGLISVTIMCMGLVVILSGFQGNKTLFLRQQTGVESRNCSCHGEIASRNRTEDAEYKIPNLVHYIWYSHNTNKSRELTFTEYIGMLSVHKFQKPTRIYFHTNQEPIGRYWEMAKLIPEFRVKLRGPPSRMFGLNLKQAIYGTSDSNIDRVRFLHRYGGIYLDMDVFVVRSLDPLRRYDCVVGLESASKLCGGIVLGAPRSCFLKLWIEHYLMDYHPSYWSYNSGMVPSMLARRYPNIVHVEPRRIHRPSWAELHLLYSNTSSYPWRDNYTLHLWNAMFKFKENRGRYIYQLTPDNILTLSSVFGQAARHIYLNEH